MAELKLLALDDVLTADQLKRLTKKLTDAGVADIPDGDDGVDFEDSLTEDQLTDFMDRLEAHDIACDIYLPVEFDGRIEIGDLSFGSAFRLSEALDEIHEELDIADDDDGEGEDDIDVEMIEEQLRHAWRSFVRATHTSIERQVPLHVIA